MRSELLKLKQLVRILLSARFMISYARFGEQAVDDFLLGGGVFLPTVRELF